MHLCCSDDSRRSSRHAHGHVSACCVARVTLVVPVWPWEPPCHTGQADLFFFPGESSRVTSTLKSHMSRDCRMSPSHHHHDSCHVTAALTHTSFLPPLCKAKGWPESTGPRCKGQGLSFISGVLPTSASTPGPGSAKQSCVPGTPPRAGLRPQLSYHQGFLVSPHPPGPQGIPPQKGGDRAYGCS